MQEEDAAIKIKGMSKVFQLVQEEKNRFSFTGRKYRKNNFFALKDISLEIKKGECLGLIGRNGCGKTTLLKLIAGIYKPTKGDISINGEMMSFIELGTGFEPELTGRENIFVYGSLLGLNRNDIEKKLSKIIEYAQLEKFIDSKLKTYSSGMQVRLAFATAMVHNPDILLIDEVLTVGDESFQKKSFERIKELKKEGKTMVIASHSMDQIVKLCDRVVLLDRGEIKICGDAGEITEYYLTNLYEADMKNLLERAFYLNEEIGRLEQSRAIGNYESSAMEWIENKKEILLDITKDVERIIYSKLDLVENAIIAQNNSQNNKDNNDNNDDKKNSVRELENTKLALLRHLKQAYYFNLQHGGVIQRNKAVEKIKGILKTEDFLTNYLAGESKATSAYSNGLQEQESVLVKEPALMLANSSHAIIKKKKIISIKKPTVEFEIKEDGSTMRTEISQEIGYTINESKEVPKESLPVTELISLLREQYASSIEENKDLAFSELFGLLEEQIKRTQNMNSRLKLLFELEELIVGELKQATDTRKKRELINSAGHFLREEINKRESKILELNLLNDDMTNEVSRLGQALNSELKNIFSERLESIERQINEHKQLIQKLDDYQVRIYNMDSYSQNTSQASHPEQELAGYLGWGSHEIEITRVKFCNSEGRENHLFRPGEKFIAEIEYLAHKKIKNPMIGIAIHTDKGVHICGSNTTFSHQKIPELDGSGKICFTIDSLPLLEGTYLFSASIYDYLGSYPYDHQSKKYHFRVIPNGLKDKYAGLVSLPCHWQF